MAHIFMRQQLVSNYLEQVYTQDGFSAIGFKFMLNHLRGFPSVRSYINENNIHVIHVVRNNVFDTYLSRLTMLARGIAHSTSNQVKQVQVSMPVDRLIDDLTVIQQDGEQWADMFKGKTPYIRVNYESFVDNRDEELERITGFLGVNQKEKLNSQLKKINKGKLSDMIENYEEVKVCLKGTEFEWCLSGRE